MSHVLYTVQTNKAVPRSQYQRIACTVYTQRPGLTGYHGSDTSRHAKSRRPVRTVDQTLRQDDRYLDSAVARRRCTSHPVRSRSPGESSSRKRSRQLSRSEVMDNSSQNLESRADDLSDRVVLPLSEFSTVKETFLQIFSQCSEVIFLSISCALSCVLRSFRPLQKAEIAAAVILYLASRSVSTSEFVCEEDLSASWLSQCGKVLTEDENGFIRFTHSSFQLFLCNYRIGGIDSTHATLATICLLQVEIQISQKVGQDAQSACAKAQHLATKALSAYAASFWISHYWSVQKTRPDLARKVHRILSIKWGSETDLAVQASSAPKFLVSKEAVEFCAKNDLHILVELYSQKQQERGILSPDQTSQAAQSPSPSQKKTMSTLLVSDVQTTNEAFEQLDLSDSVEATSSSECEGWTKLRSRHK